MKKTKPKTDRAPRLWFNRARYNNIIFKTTWNRVPVLAVNVAGATRDVFRDRDTPEAKVGALVAFYWNGCRFHVCAWKAKGSKVDIGKAFFDMSEAELKAYGVPVPPMQEAFFDRLPFKLPAIA